MFSLHEFEWMDDAQCLGTDTSLFFPEKNYKKQLIAKTLCAVCIVREECLDYAISLGIREGIFGGLNPRERKKLGK